LALWRDQQQRVRQQQAAPSVQVASVRAVVTVVRSTLTLAGTEHGPAR
jgi:hypothetical protein